MTATASVSRPLRKLLAAGPAIFRDGNTLITGDACPAELLPELEALCLPRISEAEGKAVVALLKEHAGRVRYVVEEEEAVDVVAELLEAEALAFDVETAPLPHYRSPVPLAFTKSGTLRKRQPTTGVGRTGSRSVSKPRPAGLGLRRDKRRRCRVRHLQARMERARAFMDETPNRRQRHL